MRQSCIPQNQGEMQLLRIWKKQKNTPLQLEQETRLQIQNQEEEIDYFPFSNRAARISGYPFSRSFRCVAVTS